MFFKRILNIFSIILKFLSFLKIEFILTNKSTFLSFLHKLKQYLFKNIEYPLINEILYVNSSSFKSSNLFILSKKWLLILSITSFLS